MQCLKCSAEAVPRKALCEECLAKHEERFSPEAEEARTNSIMHGTKHQEVVADDQTAGFLLRFLAFWIDAAIILCGRLILMIVATTISMSLLGVTSLFNSNLGQSGAIMLFLPIAMGMICVFLFGVLYYSILESSKYGATFGKKLFRLRVVNTYGEGLSFKHSLGRTLARFTPLAIVIVGGIFAFLLKSGALILLSAAIGGIASLIQYPMILFTENAQALHDRISDTYVVRSGQLTNEEFIVRAILSCLAALFLLIVSFFSGDSDSKNDDDRFKKKFKSYVLDHANS